MVPWNQNTTRIDPNDVKARVRHLETAKARILVARRAQDNITLRGKK